MSQQKNALEITRISRRCLRLIGAITALYLSGLGMFYLLPQVKFSYLDYEGNPIWNYVYTFWDKTKDCLFWFYGYYSGTLLALHYRGFKRFRTPLLVISIFSIVRVCSDIIALIVKTGWNSLLIVSIVYAAFLLTLGIITFIELRQEWKSL